MAITAQCPTCGEALEAATGQVGKLLTCENCGGPVRIPALSPSSPKATLRPLPPTPAPLTAVPPTGGQWYYRVLGEEFGPFSFADLQGRARERKVAPDNEV